MAPLVGIVYAVKHPDGKIVKIGSTAGRLSLRAIGYRKEEWFRTGGYSLVPIRTIEHEDPDFFLLYLRAVETLEISRNRTWTDQGGRNAVSPLRQQLTPLDRFREICRAAGKMAGLKAKQTGQISRLGKIQGRIQGPKNAEHLRQAIRRNVESGLCSELGKRNGRRAAESGQIQRLGKLVGRVTWEKNGRGTRFKKEQRPHNFIPIGTIKPNTDGYLRIKVADNLNAGIGALNKNWKFLHLYVWEAAHGPAPQGHTIIFKDGNKGNVKLPNLKVISRIELMRRNTIHNKPAPIRRSILLKGAVKRKETIARKKEEKQGLLFGAPA